MYFEELTLPEATEERDARWLNGGNFFGTELEGPPPRDPDDLPPPPEPAAAAPSEPPKLILKLPGKTGGRKSE
jgi:hypothetical protein